MERRLAVTYIVSATTTLGIACVAIAAVGGGLFASAAPKLAGGKQVELIDDYIVVHSETTAETIAGAADLGAAAVAAVPAITGTAASSAPSAPADTSAPAATAAAPQQSSGAAPDAPRPESQVPTTPAEPVTTAGAPTPVATQAPSPAPTAAPTTQQPAPAPTAAPTTQQPAPTVTPAAPAVAVPQARIPSDWPASKPIPPIPPGCKKPQLEDNGVWNCQ